MLDDQIKNQIKSQINKLKVTLTNQKIQYRLEMRRINLELDQNIKIRSSDHQRDQQINSQNNGSESRSIDQKLDEQI